MNGCPHEVNTGGKKEGYDMVELRDLDGVVSVKVGGKLSSEDYQILVPQLEARIKEQGNIRLLWEMENFEGWTPEALWHDARFDLKHNADVMRVAMVGEARWQDWLTQLMKPFAKGDVRYFSPFEREIAWRWVSEGT
jgi:hypothetical protein